MKRSVAVRVNYESLILMLGFISFYLQKLLYNTIWNCFTPFNVQITVNCGS